ncbi:RNA polymerase sigma factor [Agromyces laixinhei]|uniref:RNA polymerase sigma factor n=1 Tax=Agromyces laixinhei TaxID=2585717 RepID=UPI001F2CB465|nr:sigma-70 family RNA polymerase sigma factor [Agromyces laixinhei]
MGHCVLPFLFPRHISVEEVHVEDHSSSGDGELLADLARGERRALSILFDRHAAAVTRYGWALATSRQDLEEIVQDTFITLWRRSAEIVLHETSLLPWLLTTCRYLAANAGRKHARNHADELPDEALLDHAPHARRAADDAREQLRWVFDEIARLEPIDRRVCELCLIEGLTYGEAANVLGLSVPAVKQRVLRSRARLRKAVAADEN